VRFHARFDAREKTTLAILDDGFGDRIL